MMIKIRTSHHSRRLAIVTAGAAILAASAAVVAPEAQASAGWIGPGYTNNTHGVWCVQHLVNDVIQKWDVDHQYGDWTHGGRPMTEDGIFGPQTEHYIKVFQDINGYGTDGIVGPGTGAKMLEEGDQYYGGLGYCYWYIPTP
jgi:peptidoglycan hydrolase-like protein with peptidoglycan-binding domain